jgi:hypothetical protein
MRGVGGREGAGDAALLQPAACPVKPVVPTELWSAPRCEPLTDCNRVCVCACRWVRATLETVNSIMAATMPPGVRASVLASSGKSPGRTLTVGVAAAHAHPVLPVHSPLSHPPTSPPYTLCMREHGDPQPPWLPVVKKVALQGNFSE